MGRGYLDFERLFRLHEAGSFFVTRAKSNLKAERRYSHPVDRASGLICDQTVILSGYYSHKGFPVPLRRIKYIDPKTRKRLVFLTNQFALPALSIADLYRCRWQVGVSRRRTRLLVGESPTEVKRLRPRSSGGAVAREQDGGALRQHTLKGACATHPVVM